ncbi:MAG: hypothetical protein LBE08_05770 [Bifidobacteriaceae bacterium]|jgi:hypothetical protein|nr:hypothetical protein [Bifidobacteriaceae bacterium]
MTNKPPTPPLHPQLDPADPRTKLQAGVRNALLALPGEFTFDNPISGVDATDLFGLNSLLGTAIETEVVRTLNHLRKLWDSEGEWVGYSFERSSQAFPDVRLVRRDTDGVAIALGIELKGWWLFAKEGVPSLRYQVSPAACASHDLVCVVPWHLSNAVSGVASVIEPWIESARYAAEWRDYWWQHLRETDDDRRIDYPAAAAPYPTKAYLVSAVPAYDRGGNFGRLPRARPLMDSFIQRSRSYLVLGIPVSEWVWFLSRPTDTSAPLDIARSLQAKLVQRTRSTAPSVAEQILANLLELRDLLEP